VVLQLVSYNISINENTIEFTNRELRTKNLELLIPCHKKTEMTKIISVSVAPVITS
jgi:hypothetical protein